MLILALLASCTTPTEKVANYEITYSKANCPIELDVKFQTEPVIGKNTKLIVGSCISCGADNFEISIVNADKFQKPLNKSFKGKVGKSERAQISHEFFVDASQIEFAIIAKAEFPDGTKFIKEAHVSINKSKPNPKGKPNKNSKGEDIIEFLTDK